MKSFLIKLAVEAGCSLKNNFGKVTSGRQKTVKGDIVTVADYAAEKIILNQIKNKYPDYNILAEESGSFDKGSDYTFIIDPLDGTRNFILGIPLFATTIALAYKDKVIEGVCFDPLHNEMYYAKKDKGAFLNARRIFTDKEKTLDHVALGVGNVKQYTNNNKYSELRKNLNESSAYWRVYGTAVLDFCYVANGRMSLFVLGGVRPWDVAAAGLIVQEAGGIVTKINGQKWDALEDKQEVMACSTKEINEKIINIIKKIK
ncbi:MAG: inositol monophosphatase family protein, partial [Patescibacteria group bacterium]